MTLEELSVPPLFAHPVVSGLSSAAASISGKSGCVVFIDAR